MSYPLNKYRFYTTGGKVIAVSSYAGQRVRGVAKCSPEDVYDFEKGKALAAARCAVKIAEKRMARADRKVFEATQQYDAACNYLDKMKDYRMDAMMSLDVAEDTLAEILDEV